MGAVIALVGLLVVLLSGLTAGLSAQSVSALDTLPADRLAFAAPAQGQQLSFAGSRLSAEQVHAFTSAAGADAAALGVANGRVGVGRDSGSSPSSAREVTATVFGAVPDGFLAPPALAEGAVVVSDELADEQHLATGDTVQLGGQSLRVAAVRTSSSFNHTPVVWTTLDQWRRLDAAGGAAATVVALRGGPVTDAVPGTTVRTLSDARTAVGSYTAENGSLTLMRLLLLAISALVVGAFFTVWTVQRQPDLAVLKAIGASSDALVRDALGQSLVVLVVGGGLGTVLAAGVGLLAQRVVPFVVSPATTALPLLALIVVGLVGAAAAVRRITSVDPLTALRAAR
ncbi:MAG TPA: ABC transporter permease [Actinomycetales bacterium]|nr:ABC transporter permease [Actinomycetales bacterium]